MIGLGQLFGRAIETSALIRRILVSILLLSLIAGVGGFYLILRERALAGAARQANLLLTTALDLGDFVDDEVFSLAAKLPDDHFYKQIVPFYATSSVFARLRSRYPNLSFRQAALNPTNPNDRAMPHEVELIGRFRDDPKLTSLDGIRDDGRRSLFYVAHPVRVTDPRCLTCHSTPEKAPATMLAAYGRSNGFNWQLNDTIGIVELSVPITEELRGAAEMTATLGCGLLLVFLAVYLALTGALHAAVVTPLKQLATAADAASRSSDAPLDLDGGGTLELRRLARAIGRLDTSLRKALWPSQADAPSTRSEG